MGSCPSAEEIAKANRKFLKSIIKGDVQKVQQFLQEIINKKCSKNQQKPATNAEQEKIDEDNDEAKQKRESDERRRKILTSLQEDISQIRAENNATALHYASANGHAHIVTMILDHLLLVDEIESGEKKKEDSNGKKKNKKKKKSSMKRTEEEQNQRRSAKIPNKSNSSKKNENETKEATDDSSDDEENSDDDDSNAIRQNRTFLSVKANTRKRWMLKNEKIKALVEARDDQGFTALHLAKHHAVVRLLLDAGSDVNAKTLCNTQTFPRGVNKIKAAGAGAVHDGDDDDDDDESDATTTKNKKYDNFSPLHFACALPIERQSEAADIVAELIEAGCDRNARTQDGNSALHFAALAGNSLLVRGLVSVGYSAPLSIDAEEKSRNSNNRTTDNYHRSRHGDLSDVGEGGKNKHVKTSSSGSNVKNKRMNKSSKEVHHESFYEFINQRNAKNETPLLYACRSGSKASVDILLAAGADPEIFSTAPFLGRIPIDAASTTSSEGGADGTQQRQQFAPKFASASPSFSSSSSNATFWSPLSAAIYSGNFDIVKTLLYDRKVRPILPTHLASKYRSLRHFAMTLFQKNRLLFSSSNENSQHNNNINLSSSLESAIQTLLPDFPLQHKLVVVTNRNSAMLSRIEIVATGREVAFFDLNEVSHSELVEIPTTVMSIAPNAALSNANSNTSPAHQQSLNIASTKMLNTPRTNKNNNINSNNNNNANKKNSPFSFTSPFATRSKVNQVDTNESKNNKNNNNNSPSASVVVGHTFRVLCCSFSHHRRHRHRHRHRHNRHLNQSESRLLLATGSADNSICIWDAQSGHLRTVIRNAHSSAVRALCFSQDNRCLYSGSQSLRTWNVKTGIEMCDPVKEHKDKIISLAVTSWGEEMDGGVSRHDDDDNDGNIDDEKQGGEQNQENNSASFLLRGTSTSFLATGSFHEIFLWDVSTVKRRRNKMTMNKRYGDQKNNFVLSSSAREVHSEGGEGDFLMLDDDNNDVVVDDDDEEEPGVVGHEGGDYFSQRAGSLETNSGRKRRMRQPDQDQNEPSPIFADGRKNYDDDDDDDDEGSDGNEENDENDSIFMLSPSANPVLLIKIQQDSFDWVKGLEFHYYLRNRQKYSTANNNNNNNNFNNARCSALTLYSISDDGVLRVWKVDALLSLANSVATGADEDRNQERQLPGNEEDPLQPLSREFGTSISSFSISPSCCSGEGNFSGNDDDEGEKGDDGDGDYYFDVDHNNNESSLYCGGGAFLSVATTDGVVRIFDAVTLREKFAPLQVHNSLLLMPENSSGKNTSSSLTSSSLSLSTINKKMRRSQSQQNDKQKFTNSILAASSTSAAGLALPKSPNRDTNIHSKHSSSNNNSINNNNDIVPENISELLQEQQHQIPQLLCSICPSHPNIIATATTKTRRSGGSGDSGESSGSIIQLWDASTGQPMMFSCSSCFGSHQKKQHQHQQQEPFSSSTTSSNNKNNINNNNGVITNKNNLALDAAGRNATTTHSSSSTSASKSGGTVSKESRYRVAQPSDDSTRETRRQQNNILQYELAHGSIIQTLQFSPPFGDSGGDAAEVFLSSTARMSQNANENEVRSEGGAIHHRNQQQKNSKTVKYHHPSISSSSSASLLVLACGLQDGTVKLFAMELVRRPICEPIRTQCYVTSLRLTAQQNDEQEGVNKTEKIRKNRNKNNLITLEYHDISGRWHHLKFATKEAV